MTKRLKLDELEVTSFVTQGESKGGTSIGPVDDGTLNMCHCPTAICTPSADRGWTICCL